MFYTIQTAAEALEQIIAQAESDSLTDQPVSNETIHLLRQALYAVQAEEAIEEANA